MSAKWPTSVAADADLGVAVNNLSTTLNGAIDNVTTTVVLTSATGFPTAGYVTIGTEAIKYTGISTNTLTGVTRGADGTTAASQSNGAAVNQFIVAAHHNDLKNEIEAIETYLNANLGTGATPLGTSTALTSDGSSKITSSTTTTSELQGLHSLTVSSPVRTTAGGILTTGAATLSSSTDVTGTLPVANGGTGQTSYTDGQLLIGNTTGNTLAKATLTGTTNQVTVTNGHGTITLATPQSIDSTASPTFAGATLTGVTASRALSTNGSSVIAAATTTLTELNLLSGSVVVTSFTPTFSAGFGTVTSSTQCYYAIFGKLMALWCTATTGTTAGSTCTMTLPASKSHAITTGNSIVGRGTRQATGGDLTIIAASSSATAVGFAPGSASATPLTVQNGNIIFANAEIFSFFAVIPIQ